MSTPTEAFEYIFVWHALSDACPKCTSLNGQEFRDQNLFQQRLFSHIWGDIWDLDADHTLAHPNCRCQVEVRVNIDWSKRGELEELRKIVNEVRMTVE